MKYVTAFCLFIALASCKNKSSTNEADNGTLSVLLNKYPVMELPFSVADSTLNDLTDTTAISYNDYMTLAPDSLLKPEFGNNKKLTIRPVGRISRNKNEYFAITLVSDKSRSALYLTVFVKDSFSASLPLVVTNNDPAVQTASIDGKFNIEKKKIWTNKEGTFYAREVLSYTGPGAFTTVLNETNENRDVDVSVYSSLDTLPRTFKFSGNYKKNKESFISIRDGKKEGEYKFFVHFESKGEEPCGGELKGEFNLISEKEAKFTEPGDPCVINFTFSGNRVLVKEEGSCGNHRGITCFFNDTFTKVKEDNPPRKK